MSGRLLFGCVLTGPYGRAGPFLHLSLRERSTAKPAGEGLGNFSGEAVNPHPDLRSDLSLRER
ncbi:MAG: hypothetical protein ABS35_29850 [Kaistia sp. SCN 65-12]|nr:MAG: hypothetical protein ABS35_29850 [Kaistia sp. SCN 65-12]